MSESKLMNKTNAVAIPSLVAAVISLVGLVDSAYLTAKHIRGDIVPCSVLEGCERVLTSSYSEFYGFPLAGIGAIGYFIAFSFSILTYFGNTKFWNLFGVQSCIMFLVSLYLLYLQAFVIGAFCQYCLLSIATSTLLFITYGVSRLISLKA